MRPTVCSAINKPRLIAGVHIIDVALAASLSCMPSIAFESGLRTTVLSISIFVSLLVYQYRLRAKDPKFPEMRGKANKLKLSYDPLRRSRFEVVVIS